MTEVAVAPIEPDGKLTEPAIEPRSKLPKMFSSLEEPGFRVYLMGMLFSNIPMTMQQVTQGYLAYTIAGNAMALGIVTLASGIPMTVLTLIGGAISDRYPRRRILIITQTSLAVITFCLALLIHTGIIEVWHLVVTSFLQGIVWSFNMPSRQGLLPDVVSREGIANAVALNTSSMNLCRILGPSIAGALIAVPAVGIAGVYDLMSFSYLIAVFNIFQLKLPAKQSGKATGPIITEIADGFRYIFRHPVLPTLMLLAFVPILIGMPYQTLMPVFAVRVLDVGSPGLGLLMTMGGVGALIGSLSVAALSEHPRKANIQLFAVIGFGIALFLFSRSEVFWVSVLLMPLVGGLGNVYMAMNQTMLMMQADREYFGRVLGIYMLTWSITPITTLPITTAVDAFGAPATVAVMGILVAVLSIIIAVTNPRYRKAA